MRACGVFVHTTNLMAEDEKANETAPKNDGSRQEPKKEAWVRTVEKAIETASRDDGWAHLAAVGHYIRDIEPAFDPRTFGYKKFSGLVASRTDLFRTRETKNDNGATVIEVQLVH